MRLLFAALSSALVLCASNASAHPAPRPVQECMALPFVPADQERVELPLRLEGEDCTLRLVKHSLRAPGFHVQLQDEERRQVLEAQELVAPATYRGVVVGPDGGQRDVQVAASRGVDGTWTAMLLGPSSLRSLQPTAPASMEHVVIDARQLAPDLLECGASSYPSAEDLLGTGRSLGGGGLRGSAGTYQTEIAIEADFKYYKLLNKDVDATVADIESVLNAVDLIFRRDLDISYEIPFFLIRMSRTDNYQLSRGLLTEMREYWNANLPHVPRDIVHLFTGFDTGGVIGTAELFSICKLDRAYGWSASRFTTNFAARTVLTAHELGHNWGGSHCDARPECRIMCSFVGGCNGGSQFTDKPIADMTAYRDRQTCLDLVETDAALPAYDSFEAGVVDSSLWTYARGVQVVPGIGGEPNGDFCLELNSEGLGEAREDELRSGRLQLPGGGLTEMFLSFYHRPQGVPAGDELRVEFYDQDLLWKPLRVLSSTGADPSEYEFQRLSLQGLAWDGLRLRLRVTTSDPGHRWFVDDVQIRERGLSYAVSPLIPGQAASLVSRGAQPGDLLYFLYSPTGLGSGPCFGGVCLDLLAPLEALSARRADSSGEARIDLQLPPGLPMMDVYLQNVVSGVAGWATTQAVPTRVR